LKEVRHGRNRRPHDRARVERLFGVIEDPKTGETYTSARVAQMSLGDLTEECIEGILAESIADPTLKQVSALARRFGVEPSYLVDGTAEALTGGEIALALGDDTIREIMRGCARLPGREKDLILGIVRQFEEMGADDDADSPTPTRQRLTRTDSRPRSVCPSHFRPRTKP
jgi:hypothetical protein